MDILGTSLCLGLLVLLVEGKKDGDLYCTVCRIVVDELAYAISQVSPDKKVQVGSFRIDPQGNQARYMVPYARSDVHITEMLEQVCDKMGDYAEMTHDGQTNIVRTSARDGKYISLKKVDVNPDLHKKLKFYCESVLEEHEDDIVGLLKKENIPNTSLESILCGEISAACSEKQLSVPLATGLAEVDTMPEEDEEKPDEDADTPDEAGGVDKQEEGDKKENEGDDEDGADENVIKEEL
ncbi:protein canopy homolog 1-like [Gigantopelta aegis]|uniref:protein canopy homolog 1-like n=1 Tax=Gigantopelta aegis TaxID=1735272 RepID=UPI001B88A691|nr:protein canopy homolog 1-like [Gigantopelta aegis]